MFHQFKVVEAHRNFLRFLWWEDGDVAKARALHQAVQTTGSERLRTITKTTSDQKWPTSSETIFMWMMDLSRSTTKGLCARGCLRLHTFVLQGSNFCDSSRRPFVSVEEPQSFHDRLPIERALGVQWCVETDTFQLRITVQDTPLTRRSNLPSVQYMTLLVSCPLYC